MKRYRRNAIGLAITTAFSFASATASAAPGDPLGPAFAVPLLPSNRLSQRQPAVARNRSGAFVVVWLDSDSSNRSVIDGRRFAADGSPLDDGFEIAPVPALPYLVHDVPRVALGADGDFLVTWFDRVRYPQSDTGPQQAYARRYHADGTAAGGPQALDSDDATLHDGPPAVAVDEDGDYVIAWERARLKLLASIPGYGYGSSDIELEDRQIVMRRYAADGSPKGSVATVGTRPSQILNIIPIAVPILGPAAGFIGEHSLGADVDVAIDAHGDSIVAWTGDTQGAAYACELLCVIVPAPGASSIYARRYHADGAPFGRLPILADTNPNLAANRRGPPHVAAGTNGGFIVAWTDVLITNPHIRVRRFAANGARLGAAIDAASISDFHAGISLASDAAGNFALAWTGTAAVKGNFPPIALREYSTDGTPFGPVRSLTDAPPIYEDAPSVSLSPSGAGVVVWPAYLGAPQVVTIEGQFLQTP